ncbi:hypothetical protein DBP12_09450 [Streptomyces sp. CS014]|nr:hypothetical protein DBP12_09450 [Streptomyces sp. CS014]
MRAAIAGGAGCAGSIAGGAGCAGSIAGGAEVRASNTAGLVVRALLAARARAERGTGGARTSTGPAHHASLGNNLSAEPHPPPAPPRPPPP